MIDTYRVIDFMVLRLWRMYDGGHMLVDRGGASEALGAGDKRAGGARTEWRQFISPNWTNNALVRPCVAISFPLLDQIDGTLKGATITGDSAGHITADSPHAYLEGTMQVMVMDQKDQNYEGAYSLANRIAEQWPSGYRHTLPRVAPEGGNPEKPALMLSVGRAPRVRGGFTDDDSFNVPVLVSFSVTKGGVA